MDESLRPLAGTFWYIDLGKIWDSLVSTIAFASFWLGLPIFWINRARLELSISFRRKINCFGKNHTINYEFIHVYIPSKNGESDLFYYKIESNLGTTRAVTPGVAVRRLQSHSLQMFKPSKRSINNALLCVLFFALNLKAYVSVKILIFIYEALFLVIYS